MMKTGTVIDTERAWWARRPTQCAIDTLLGTAWVVFAFRAYWAWQADGSVDMLLLLVVNSLFAALFIFRRREAQVSRDPLQWAATAVTVLLSFCVVNSPSIAGFVMLSHPVKLFGMLVIIFSLVSLGRSFGLVPANRGVKVSGLYRIVRHPLYGGEVIVYLAFVMGNFCLHNVLVVGGILLGLYYRANAEERFLSQDRKYCGYLNRVRYRFIPGVF